MEKLIKKAKKVLTNQKALDIINLQKQIHIDNLKERKVQTTRKLR